MFLSPIPLHSHQTGDRLYPEEVDAALDRLRDKYLQEHPDEWVIRETRELLKRERQVLCTLTLRRKERA
jgi:hypothetical protein